MTSTNKQRVYEIIFQKIQSDITSGILNVGDKLPPERELSAKYSVSRTSIREALRLLELTILSKFAMVMELLLKT